MQFEGVWFRYGRRSDWALRAVDAVVSPGETIVVLGRNGAGKSTLLQLAAGVLRPIRGTVRNRPPVVGWVPERFPAEQPFTAGQYLLRTAAVRGLDTSTAARAVHGWAERLGLTQHLDCRLAALSKGTAQKVGLAQALLDPPGLLVLDEPWEGLDAVARTMVPEIVAEVTGSGGAVLVSDHRGEITGLTDAVRWSVEATTVRRDVDPVPAGCACLREDDVRAGEMGEDDVVVEIAVRRTDAPVTMARLRADGHRVLAVRQTSSTATAAGTTPSTAAGTTPSTAAGTAPGTAAGTTAAPCITDSGVVPRCPG